ncbi:50S ribosomal protein L11 methyltransferase [Prevotella melaninogenica]|uniref:50S ribosomal protein L11 methyltransferase n=1 Tax=Prevotella melaninogenica TaxID=28132 RepID=UPI0024303725|nr:50S ribosomal protein L11 methyltransferase [Prevotella melaninogenica]
MKYIQVKFTAEPDSQDVRDIIAALAAEVGFDSFTDEPDGLVGYCQEDLFNKETLTEIIQSLPIPDVKVSFEAAKAEDKNWNEEWEKAGFDPIIIDDRCAIICKNMEEDATATYPQLEKIPMKITIDAQQAFGTGTHETTQMIVSLLLNQDLKEKRVLDCGCGTGILGIVAAKCGAKEVVSYDIDEWSVRNAEHNAELNGVELDVLKGDRRVLSHVSGVFDVILANINRNIILEDIDEFVSVMTTESKIILSGFYEQDAEAIIQKANELGLKENQRLLNHDWCCLLLERQ